MLLLYKCTETISSHASGKDRAPDSSIAMPSRVDPTPVVNSKFSTLRIAEYDSGHDFSLNQQQVVLFQSAAPSPLVHLLVSLLCSEISV